MSSVFVTGGWGWWNNDIEFILSQHALALSYIYQPRHPAGVSPEENKTSGEAWCTTTSSYLHALYISPTRRFFIPTPALGPLFSHFISCSLFHRCMLHDIHPRFSHLFYLLPLPVQPSPSSLSVFLPGGEHNLISQRWMRRPLLSGSRWWKIRPFGLSSFYIHTALLAAREHQITLNLGSLTPLILNGRLI